MLRILAALLLLTGVARAQDYPGDLDSTMVTNQVSGENVSSFVFAIPNSQRKGLRSLEIKNAAAAGFAMLVDGTSLPSGAVASCTDASVARPCLMWCAALPANSALYRQWDSPLKFQSGIVAGYSTTGCATITASATAMFFGQVP